jgi:membrane-associated phospholipid phosphatase
MMKVFCVFIYLLPLGGYAQQCARYIGSKDSSDVVSNNSNLAGGVHHFLFDKSHSFSFLTHVPGDLLGIAKIPFEKNSLKAMGIVAASTAILLPFDQRIANSIASSSRQIGLKPNPEYDKIVGVGVKTLVKWPDNLNSAFYQLGEGTPTLGLTGLLFVYGKITKDTRSSQAASDLMEAYLSMGITVQTLKRISGRQPPFKATVPGGRWQPFPPLSKYQRRTTEYDAFPSGHLATMMATTTVLAENYPEKKWIRPVGYLLTGLTGWSMINNKVHWASDFPLGLGIGYVAGRLAYKHHKKEEALRQVTL